MAVYVWHYGFDINAVQRSNTLSYLPNGLVVMPQSGSPEPASPLTDLNPGDTISFFAFDITEPPSSINSIIGAMLTFSNALTGQSNPYPFDSAPIPLADGSTVSPQLVNGSAIIQVGSKPLAVAHQNSPQGPSAIFGQINFPQWGILPGLTINQTGRFLLTVALTVQASNGSGGTTTRTFVVDPEMIFGGT